MPAAASSRPIDDRDDADEADEPDEVRGGRERGSRRRIGPAGPIGRGATHESDRLAPIGPACHPPIGAGPDARTGGRGLHSGRDPRLAGRPREGRPRPRAARPGRRAVAARGGARRRPGGAARSPAGGSTSRSPAGGRRRRPRTSPTTGSSTASRSRRSTTTSPAACGSRRSPSSSRGSRRATTDDDAVLDAADLAFGPPVLRPPSLRDFYAFEGHVRTMWERRGGEVPEAWYRLPIFYFSNVSEIRGPDEPVWAPAASSRARLRAGGGGADRHARGRPARRARRGGDRRLHDPQRLVGARPPARRDGRPARAGEGQGLRARRSGRGS